MAVPKEKGSPKREERKRRSNVWKLQAPALVEMLTVRRGQDSGIGCAVAAATTIGRKLLKRTLTRPLLSGKVEEEKSSLFFPLRLF